MARSSSSQKNTSSKASTSKPRSQKLGKNPRTPNLVEPIVDSQTRRHIAGVVIMVLAVVLFIMALIPSTAVVSSFIRMVLGLGFGLGAFIFPVFLFVLGLSFILKFGSERVPTRVAIGLTMIFVAALALLSVYTPGVTDTSLETMFLEESLKGQGGYVGAGIAWAGITLFGQLITTILMIGVIIVALLIIGFSVSALIEKIDIHRGLEKDANVDDQAAPVQSRRSQRLLQEDASAKASSRKRARALPSGNDSDDQRGNRRSRTSSAKTELLNDVSNAETAVFTPVDTSSFAQPEQPMTRRLSTKDKKALTEANKSNMSSASAESRELAYKLPDFKLLKTTDPRKAKKTKSDDYAEVADILEETVGDFGIQIRVAGWIPGPTVTLYKIELPAGVKVSRLTNLNDDIALALASPGIRIFAPIPGTNYVGIEVPNRDRESVPLGDVLREAPSGLLQIAIGKDVEGHCIVSDLAAMPHLLIGGTTGSGKSVLVNGMIMSILMRTTPDEVRFIMIDPKRVEFTLYNGIPHLYTPVVTEPKEAASALAWGVAEMESRLKRFSKVGARNIGQYNDKIRRGEECADSDPIPYIVIVIDELADLMMNAGKEVEFSISRIAQLARAAGIHLIIATQRPSANVVTGLIKANITNRIALNVASGIDSRVILDTPGAENLLPRGDLLLSKPEFAKPQRIQGCYVSEDEINAVVDFWKNQGEPDYHTEILKTNLITLGDSSPDGSGGDNGADDPLFWDAAEMVVSNNLGSTSNLQRRFKIGYSRAGRIMDMLEEKGIVGPQNGSKPREVLVDALELEALRAFEEQDSE